VDYHDSDRRTNYKHGRCQRGDRKINAQWLTLEGKNIISLDLRRGLGSGMSRIILTP
jgi:hypothetical protein